MTSNDFVLTLWTLENEALEPGVLGIEEARDSGMLYAVDALVGGAMYGCGFSSLGVLLVAFRVVFLAA